MSELRIHKYPLEVTDWSHVQMPKGARVLSVDVQRGELNAWALVDPDAEMEDRRFRILGTGHATAKHEIRGRFLGTVLMMGGNLVFHVFEG